jgi:hypothetical protein
MANERVTELMYDTASALRLLDAELGELAPRKPADASTPPVTDADTDALAASETVRPLLPALFVRAMNEVHGMLASIRTGREHIRAATTDRLAHTNEKLDEVSSATANAAIDIMDALDRAVARVDQLDTDAVVDDAEHGQRIRAELRDDLFAVMHHMQFQDITSQQIMHVQSLLADMEGRLADIATLFDNHAGASPVTRPSTPSPRPRRAAQLFDPQASLSDAESRQALADSLVERGANGG